MAAAKKKKTDELDYEPAQLNDFVTVVEGDHAGRYGVLIEVNNEGDFVMRARDADGDRFVVKSAQVRKAEPGLR